MNSGHHGASFEAHRGFIDILNPSFSNNMANSKSFVEHFINHKPLISEECLVNGKNWE